MSFILDEIQQQHLLVILNDINRHIYEANQTTAIGSTNGGTSGTGGTANGTQPKGGKGLGGGARHPKRLVSVDHLPQPVPDLITGFNHTNKQPLTDFIINTNRYFRAFFKFTAILIGTNNNNTTDNTNDINNNTKGKHVLLWLSRFYNKLLLEHLNFEYIFDVTPDLLVSADLGLVVPTAPPPPPQPSTNKNKVVDHHQHQQHQQHQQQHQHLSHKTGTKVILNGTSVQVIPVSGTGGSQQQQQSQGSILIHPKQELELMTRAVHLHELHQLQNASTSTNPTQQVYLIDPQSSPHQQQQQIQQQQQQHQQQQQQQLQQQHQQELEFIQQQQQLENHLLSYQVSGQIIKDLTFLVLLIIYLFYKLRFIFPNLTGRFEISWKFFLNFERELDPSFLYDNFIEFIQLELCQQRAANEKRTDSLKQEVLQLEKIAKIVDKEIECEIGRLVHLQSRQQQQQQNQIQNLQNQNQQPNPVPQQKQILGSQVHQRNSSGPTVQLSTGSGSGTISLIDLKGLKLASTSSSNSLGITISGGGGANGPTSMASSSSLASPAISTGNGSLSGRACPECGKVFRNTYKLNRHLYVHKDPSEKPYVCDWTACSYRSISRNDLNRHKMIHTGEKPYLCEIEGCEKRYSRPDKLRHHKQTVHFKDSAKKEQICIYPGCNFQCVTKSELNRHQQTHEKDEKLLKQQVQVVQQVVAHAQKSNSAANQAAQAIVSAATAAATLQGVLSKDGQEYVVPISISTTPDISSIVTQQQQQQQHLVHHQQLNQQQQQSQQQHQITVPLSMLTGNQTTNLSQLMAQHPGLNLSGLTDSRLAAAAVAAVQQQQSQQQQQQNAHAQQNAHQVNSLSSLISGNTTLPEGSQVVIVPSSSANQQQQLHNQTLSAITSIPISAVVSSNNNNNSGSVSLAVSGTGNNPQRLNTVSVWST